MKADGSTVVLAPIGGSAGITITLNKESNKEVTLYVTTDTDDPSTLTYSVGSAYNGKCMWVIDGTTQGSYDDSNNLVKNTSNEFTLNTRTGGYTAGYHTLMVAVSDGKKNYSKTVQFKVTN